LLVLRAKNGCRGLLIHLFAGAQSFIALIFLREISAFRADVLLLPKHKKNTQKSCTHPVTPVKSSPHPATIGFGPHPGRFALCDPVSLHRLAGWWLALQAGIEGDCFSACRMKNVLLFRASE